jgi:hypothetical protein
MRALALDIRNGNSDHTIFVSRSERSAECVPDAGEDFAAGLAEYLVRRPQTLWRLHVLRERSNLSWPLVFSSVGDFETRTSAYNRMPLDTFTGRGRALLFGIHGDPWRLPKGCVETASVCLNSLLIPMVARAPDT